MWTLGVSDIEWEGNAEQLFALRGLEVPRPRDSTACRFAVIKYFYIHVYMYVNDNAG